MNIGLVGCGRVGTALFYMLRKKCLIVGAHDIKKANEKRFVHLLGLKENVDLQTMCKRSTALFIATPDDAIRDAYRSIDQFITGQKYVFHFSGALPSTVFPKRKGVYRAAIHPFATFPHLTIPPRRKHLSLYVEGDARARTAAERIFRGRSFSIRSISGRNKIYCHLAGVFASNFIVALLHEVSTLMKRADMSSRDLHEAVLPIIRDTLSNIEDHGIYRSLSGPLQRGDRRTIREHVKTLRHDPLLLDTYRILSLAIVKTLPHGKNKKELLQILHSE